MDFHPIHFDVATQQIPPEYVKQMGVWPESTNPKVIAKKIDCPDDLKEVVIKYCGKNAGSSATPDEYCPGHDNTTYWSLSNPEGYWPSTDPDPSPPTPSPPPTPPPPTPPPPTPTGYGCYYNQYCIDKSGTVPKIKDECSTPEIYCEKCDNTGDGVKTTYPNFGGVTDWKQVDWKSYNTESNWLNSSNQNVYVINN